MSKTATGHRPVPSFTVPAPGSLDDFELMFRAALRARDIRRRFRPSPLPGLSSRARHRAELVRRGLSRLRYVSQRRELAGMHVRGEATRSQAKGAASVACRFLQVDDPRVTVCSVSSLSFCLRGFRSSKWGAFPFRLRSCCCSPLPHVGP